MSESIEVLRLKAELAEAKRRAVTGRQLMLEMAARYENQKRDFARLFVLADEKNSLLFEIRKSWSFFLLPRWIKRDINATLTPPEAQ